MIVDETAIAAYIEETFPGLDVMESPNTRYSFYDPRRDTPHDRRHPFATLVSGNDHDQASRLHRPGVFRLNLGVPRATYRALFGPEPGWNLDGGPVATGHDFSALDVFLPHPVYAPLSWICILNPGPDNWPRAQAFLREAYDLAAARHGKREAPT